MNTSKALSLLIAALFTTAAQAQTMVSRWSNATWTSAKRGLAANPTTGNLLLVQGGTPGTIKRIKTADGTSAGSDMTYPTGGAGTYWVGGIAVASDGTIYGCNYAGSGTQYLYKWTNESATPTTLWTGSYNSGATAGEAGSVGANLAVYGTGNNAVFILASTTTGGLIIYNSGGTWTARAITVVNQSCTSGLTFIDYGVAGATLYRFVAKTGQTAGEIYTFDPTSGTGAITPGSTAMTGTFVYAANGIHGCAYDPITGLMATVTRVSSTSPYPVTNLLFNTGLVVGSGTLGNPAFLDRQNLLEGGTDSGSPGGVAWYQGAFFTSAANTLGTANLWAYDVTAFKVKDTTPAGPVTVCPGSSQSFNIVSGGSQLQYQWKVNKGSGYVNVSGSEYSGATTGTLTINPASASDAGTYECIVSQPFTGGTTWTSTGAALIVSTPPAAFNVTGGGAYCAGGSGVSIGIDGSETGKHYQVWRNNSGTPGAVGSSIAGTGSAITTLATATVADTYSVVATDDTTSCTNTMTGSVTVTVNPLPTAYNVTGGGAYCSGGDGVAVGLANSELGKNYQLYRNGGATAVGSPVPGTGSAISFGNQTTADIYTVVATDAITLCTAAMSGNATVTVNPKPTADAGPGQTVCIGCGTAIGGSPTASGGSGSDYTYSWTPASGLSSATVANPTATPTSTTTYTVTVTDGNGCSADSSVTVTVNNVAPSISAQPANTTVCSGSAANFSVTASGSSLSYSWAQNNNGGWGNAWTVSGNGSTWLGTSAANDQGNPECTSFSAAGDINSPGGNALGMWGGFDGSEVAIRTFPSLTPGQAVSIDFDNGNVDGGSKVGFSLQTAAGADVLQFYFTGGTANYSLWDDVTGAQDSGVGWTGTGLRVQFALTCGNAYVLIVTPCGGTATTLTGTYSGAIAQLKLFNGNTGGGDAENCYFNNFIVGGYTDNADNYSSGWAGEDKGNQPIALGNGGSSYTTPALTANAQYQVVVSGCGGALLSSVASATVSPLPTVSVNSQAICAGDSAMLTATSSASSPSYLWSPGGATTVSITVSPASTTTYTVTATDGTTGCANSGSGTVTVNPLPAVSVNSESICSGGSALLTATTSASSPSYLWDDPAASTTASITVSPAATTTYTVTVTDGVTGCVNTGSGTVTVNPLPTVSVNSQGICAGGSAMLTATTSASSPSYLWSPGGAITASITVSPAATTTYTVTVTDGLTGCANSGSGTVTVNPPPGVSVNSLTICAGGSANLTATTSASSPSYLWSPGGATTASITVSPAATTTYTVTVTDGVTGCANSGSGTVTVNPLPTASVNSEAVCAGSSATLTATTDAGSPSYLWSPGGATTASITVSPASTTIYTVTVTDGATHCSNSGSGTVTVNAAPTADAGADQTVCAGSAIVIGGSPTASGGTGPYTYNWSPSTGLSDATVANPTATLTTADMTYTVTVTDHNGCTADDSVTLSIVSQPELLSTTMSDTDVTLVWSSLAGWSYRVQYTTDLVSPPAAASWTDLTPDVTATGATATYTDHAGAAAQRFYRIFIVCP